MTWKRADCGHYVIWDERGGRYHVFRTYDSWTIDYYPKDAVNSDRTLRQYPTLEAAKEEVDFMLKWDKEILVEEEANSG